MRDQPTEEQELANAAYVWRKHVVSDMIEEFIKKGVSLKFEDAQFWTTRLISAFERENRANENIKP